MVHWSLENSFFLDPYPTYHRLRETAPIQWDPQLGWIVTGYSEVAALLKHDHLSNFMLPLFMAGREAPPTLERVAHHWILYIDPPHHTYLRQRLATVFTPKFVEGYREIVQAKVDRLLDDLQGEVDLVAHLGMPLPALVIAEVLGANSVDIERFYHWGETLATFIGAPIRPPDSAARSEEALVEMVEIFGQLYDRYRQRPEPNLMASLAATELTRDEVISLCALLLLAGHDTTANLICNGMLALLRDPTAHQKLLARPELVPNAIEEFLRIDSPSQVATRVALKRIEVGPSIIEPNHMVCLYIGAANRDPAQFPEPDHLNFERPAYRHVAFGRGKHFCVGAMLAKLTGQTAVTSLLERFPEMVLLEAQPDRVKNHVLRRLISLPVRLPVTEPSLY